MTTRDIKLRLRQTRLSIRAVGLRLAAGWDPDPRLGWIAPCGTTESEWLDAGYPLPEDDDFTEWFNTFYHYEAVDAGTTPNPYPNAPPSAASHP